MIKNYTAECPKKLPSQKLSKGTPSPEIERSYWKCVGPISFQYVFRMRSSPCRLLKSKYLPMNFTDDAEVLLRITITELVREWVSRSRSFVMKRRCLCKKMFYSSKFFSLSSKHFVLHFSNILIPRNRPFCHTIYSCLEMRNRLNRKEKAGEEANRIPIP